MKTQNSVVVWLKLSVVAMAIVSLVGVTGVQAATLPSSITIRNQDLSSGVIVVDSVTAPVDGWIVVYKSPNFTPGQIVGYAPVYQGVNTGVKVTIDTAKVGQLPTLWAILHSDGGVPGVFEWGIRNQSYDDAPIIVNGWYVEAAFGTAGQ